MKTEIASKLVNDLKADEGWKTVVTVAKEILHETEAAALACKDEKESIALIREAQGAKKFLSAWLNTVESLGTKKEV
jgi:hypothetical protein